ncbi:MAG TPA: amino acid permease [Candidatus Poseidoniales archaeon]|nr:MAG TPA: amino acid permease [Candidatus Poseidoniales archaeon]HIH57770.1 amino acid permease [Candidatus Poseidoniaceae archaeon]
MDIKSTTGKLLKGDISGVVSDVKSQIKRSLSLIGVIIVTVAASIGAGLFVLPSFAVAIMGPGIWLAFLIAGIVFLPGALSKSELSSAMPVNGGAYVYVERSFGPLVGTISGLGLWASFLLKSAFALIGFSAYMYAVTNYLDISTNTTLVIMAALLLITVLNIFGIKKVKAFQTPILALTTAVILIICLIQLFDANIDFSRPIDGAFDVSRNDPVLVAESAALVFVAYAGIYKAGAIGGEVKEPEKNLPKGMLISLLLITLLYVIVTFIMMASVDVDTMLNSDGSAREDPIFAFVDAVASTNIGLAMALLAVLTMVSGALSGLLAASRFLFGMAKDSLLPGTLGETNKKFGTPHWAIIITGITMAISIITLPVKDVAKLASGFQIMVIVALNISVIILRSENPKYDWYKPNFKSPLFPWVQIIGTVTGGYLVFIMGEKAIIGAVAAIVIGVATYYIYGKKNHQLKQSLSVSSNEEE